VSVDVGDLTEPELVLRDAFSCGQWADLGSGAAGPPVIRAEVIAALLLGASSVRPGSAAGIRLRGATVEGRLDLMGGEVAWPLVCEGCHFDTGIDLADCTLRTVRILDSELPAFDGSGLRLEGILDLAGSRIAGTVVLERARVGGLLRLRGVHAGVAGASGPAVLARGLSVDGEADCAGLEAGGLVSFEGGAVTGTLDPPIWSRSHLIGEAARSAHNRSARKVTVLNGGPDSECSGRSAGGIGQSS
jgi:hypothetical protein